MWLNGDAVGSPIQVKAEDQTPAYHAVHRGGRHGEGCLAEATHVTRERGAVYDLVIVRLPATLHGNKLPNALLEPNGYG